MFVGMSAMTVLEWLELLAFSVVAMPFLVFRRRGLPCVRPADEDADSGGDAPAAAAGPEGGPTDEAILASIAAITLRRRAAKASGGRGGGGGVLTA